MSMELMVKAMKIKVGNPLRKLVLLKLADNASDLGECWPSHQHIADQCEISKRSVIGHIKALADMGLLRVENRVKNNEKQSNIYYLTLDKKSSAGDSLPSATDAQGGAGDSLPSATDAQGGAGDSLPSSAGAAHRISHSSEPVNEPDSTTTNDSGSVNQIIMSKWNSSGLSPIKVISNQREKLLKARIKEFSLEQVLEAIDIAAQSDFLKGRNDKGWVMDFTWFVKPNNFIKVYEGQYVNRPQGGVYATNQPNHTDNSLVGRARAKAEASYQAMLDEETRSNR